MNSLSDCQALLARKNDQIEDNNWIIKCLFLAVLLLLTVFIWHYLKLMNESTNLSNIAKDLVFERQKNLIAENKINALTRDLRRCLGLVQKAG